MGVEGNNNATIKFTLTTLIMIDYPLTNWSRYSCEFIQIPNKKLPNFKLTVIFEDGAIYIIVVLSLSFSRLSANFYMFV